MDLHTLWSVTGGAGVTVCAAVLAAAADDDGHPVTLVDLAGDQPAMLGLADPGGVDGVVDWLAGPDHPVDALDRLLVDVHDGIQILPRGQAVLCDEQVATDRASALIGWLQQRRGVIVVDAGRGPTVGVPSGHGAVVDALAEAGRSWLVTRACYLALHRARRVNTPIDGVVLVEDPGRSLDRRDIATVLGHEVVSTVETDPGVARHVDAGAILRRRPRALARSLRSLL